jgi:GLTT repeat (6 copies)
MRSKRRFVLSRVHKWARQQDTPANSQRIFARPAPCSQQGQAPSCATSFGGDVKTIRNAAAVAALVLTGCGGGQSRDLSLRTESVDLSSDNGMSSNGLSSNGMSSNGLSSNGLSSNGLSSSGLSTTAFSTWFSANPTFSDTVMTYVVKCALPAGKTLTYNYSRKVAYTWSGNLGLAPTWASGKAIPVVEQQLISGCLAAHVNKFALHIPLSVRAVKPDGTYVPVSADEQTTYSQTEGCFFGNLFTGAGVYAAYDKGALLAGASSARACALETGLPGECPPMINTADTCQHLCVRPAKDTTFWQTCTYNGVAYQAVTTRLRAADVYTCGDGVCQFTESCYSATTGKGCQADCGLCP